MITLVSHITAKEGFKFVFTGPLTECLSCRLKPVCVDKLKLGQVYEVVKVYNIVNKCPINDYVVTVDVKEAEFEVALNRRMAIEGIVVTYSKLTCDKVWCSNYKRCVSNLIVRPVKVKVIKVAGNVQCPRGLGLSNALVKIVDTLT